jgi:hypothetical protein
MLTALLFAFAFANITLPRGFQATALASADFNGDGRADFAVASQATSQVIIYFADAKGGFTASAPLPAGTNPSSMSATSSMIVIANHETDYVTMLANDGKGHFTPRTLHLHSKPHPHAVAIGDFDRDGKADLAVDSWQENRIMLLFGRDNWRGPGTPVDIGAKPYWTISAVDLDGDGNVDLVTPNFFGQTLSILFGDGRGNFAHAAGSPFRAGPTPFSAAVGDFNGDGRPDVAIANYSGHSSDTTNDGLTWIRNDGHRRFTPFPQRVVNGNYVGRIVAGDLNGDRFTDIAFSNSNGSTVVVVYGSINGPRRAESVPVMQHPHALAIVDHAIVVASDEGDELLVLRHR